MIRKIFLLNSLFISLFHYYVDDLARDHDDLDNVETGHIFSGLLEGAHIGLHFLAGRRLRLLDGEAGLAVEGDCVGAAVLVGICLDIFREAGIADAFLVSQGLPEFLCDMRGER